MTITGKPYRPSGSWWWRTKQAFFMAYVALHHRAEEWRAEREEISASEFIDEIGKLTDAPL